MPERTQSGIDAMAAPPWGAHICQFYRSDVDLRDTLVPYFKAGLDNNERCLWVTAEPFGANEARSALRAAVSDFDQRERRGQIEIFDARAWYAENGAFKANDLVDAFRHLLDNELEMFEDGDGSRVWLDGPDVKIPANLVVTVAMAIHELTTNAFVGTGRRAVDCMEPYWRRP
jgi:hypothetical protein